METQKIINLLNGSHNENSKFAIKKWYFTDSESKGIYSKDEEIKFLTRSIKSSLSDYSDAYILVTGSIRITHGNQNTNVAFKNCAPFKKCRTKINEILVDDAQYINNAMSMYNLIKYSDNYSDTSGSLQKFKRDEIEENNNLTVDNSSSFKYKSNIIGNLSQAGTRNNVKIVIPPKYLSNFLRSLEMPLINCKVELSLKWYENCILSSAGDNATFTITDTKPYIPIVTLSAEDNANYQNYQAKNLKDQFIGINTK